jgi:hypothetical protein
MQRRVAVSSLEQVQEGLCVRRDVEERPQGGEQKVEMEYTLEAPPPNRVQLFYGVGVQARHDRFLSWYRALKGVNRLYMGPNV